MPDLTPSPLRSKANGVINLMGGLGGVLTFLGGAKLYEVYRPLPCWFGGAITLIVGPILNGWVIDLTGRNYNMIFFHLLTHKSLPNAPPPA